MIVEILAGAGKLLGSTGFGAIFGGVMGYVNRRADQKFKEMEFGHALKMREMDALILEKEQLSKVDLAAFEAMRKSYEFSTPDPGTKMSGFSSFIRPFISLCYFLVSTGASAYIVYYAFCDVGVTFTMKQWHDLVMFVLDWTFFMASTTIGWWYAMRAGTTPTRSKT